MASNIHIQVSKTSSSTSPVPLAFLFIFGAFSHLQSCGAMSETEKKAFEAELMDHLNEVNCFYTSLKFPPPRLDFSDWEKSIASMRRMQKVLGDDDDGLAAVIRSFESAQTAIRAYGDGVRGGAADELAKLQATYERVRGTVGRMAEAIQKAKAENAGDEAWLKQLKQDETYIEHFQRALPTKIALLTAKDDQVEIEKIRAQLSAMEGDLSAKIQPLLQEETKKALRGPA